MAQADTTAVRPRRAAYPLPCALSGLWWETILLVAAASLLLLAISQPAFRSYFFGDDFIYLGQYRAHGNDFWRAVLSPTDNIFFRPVFCAVNLLAQFVLPLDPWVHHVRNFIFSGVNLLLLYRVLLRLVASRTARILGLGLFALSKVHLTTIGYINVFDSIVSLLLLLATVLCFLRYAAERRTRDYALGLLCCFLAIFTKDYGLVVGGVVLALAAFWATRPSEWRSAWRWWAVRLVPLPGMVLVYLGLRYAIVGPPPANNPAYSPQLSLDVTVRKVAAFLSTLGNLSFGDNGTTGASGLGGWLTAGLPASAWWANRGDVVLGVAFVVLLGLTLWWGQRAGWALLFPLGWVAAYFGPTLLTRNLQMYYMYEALAGAAVLLALCLDRAGPRVLALWSLVLVTIGINGALSNAHSQYHWQFAANAAGRIRQPLVEAHRGEPIASVTFITDSRPFWQYVLTADMKGPMIPELLGRPDLQVRFLAPADLPAQAAAASATNLFFDIDNGFVAYQPGRSLPAPALRAISPRSTEVGTGFNVQPDGRSALTVLTEHAPPGTTVMLGDRPLATTYGDSTSLIALVPPEALARPGRYPVYLRSDRGESNRLELAIAPAATPPPAALTARGIIPAQTRAGQGFNNQPGGPAVLIVQCENAVPGTVIVVDDTPLAPSVDTGCPLSGIVPRELYSAPGRHEVYLRHDGTESNRLVFVVAE
jgi:hypothetical protein